MEADRKKRQNIPVLVKASFITEYGHVTDGKHDKCLEYKLLIPKAILTFSIVGQSGIPLLPSQSSLE